MLTKQEILLRKGARVESRRVGNPGGLLCHVACSLGFDGDGISFWVVFSFPGGARPVHALPAKMEARAGDSRRRSDMGHLLLTFPELFRWVVAY